MADEPKTKPKKPKATPKQTWLESLVGRRVKIIDEYCTNLEFADDAILREVDYQAGLLVIEALGKTLGISMRRIGAIGEVKEEEN